MKIIIVGAGLGGLSAAIAFARQGHQVTVLEQRSTLSKAGGGINVRPGATRVMNTWGLREKLKSISDPTGSFILRNVATGDVAVRSVLVNASDEIDWGTTREALMQVLFQSGQEAGVEFLFNATVEDVSEDASGASLELKDARTLTADLVLAADGIRSRVRYKILSDVASTSSLDPIVSDTTLYGIRIEGDQLRGRTDMKLICQSEFTAVWMGHGVFVVSRFNKQLNHLGALFGIQSDTDQKGLWAENGDIQYVRGRYKGSCGDLKATLELATSCDRWKLAELPNLPRWTSKGGRVVLLGDSAHGMEPNAAQGFSMIVEDIGVLEYLIGRDSNATANIPAITQLWQRIRKPRVERIKAYAKENTATFLGAPPPTRKRSESGAGNTKSLKNVAADGDAKFDSAAFIKWALDYDAVGEAKKFVEGVRANL